MDEKRNLYFQHSNGTYSIVSENCNRVQAGMRMARFMQEHNYKAPYVRCWETENGAMWFDYGSHTEFFIWANEDALDD